MFKTTSFLVLSLVTIGCSTSEARRESAPSTWSSTQPTPEPTAAPNALQTAHDAYLAGDYVGTGEAIRDVLLDPASGSIAKENALELLDATYDSAGGHLPSRFILPPGFNAMQMGALRGVSKFSVYRGMFLWMRVTEGMGTQVDEITLLDGKGTPIIEKGAPHTRTQIKHDLPGYDDVVINIEQLDALPADGVYTIRVGVAGRRVVDTWIITRHLEASATPVITAPGEQVGDPRPTVAFEPFRSPELTSFERRSLSVWISKSNGREQAFTFWTDKPEAQSQVRVDKDLPAGSYWLTVSSQERRSFGPIEIERSAQSGAPFSVTK